MNFIFYRWGTVHRNQISSNQIMQTLVFEEREKPECPEKTSRCRVENQQTQPTYDAESGN